MQNTINYLLWQINFLTLKCLQIYWCQCIYSNVQVMQAYLKIQWYHSKGGLDHIVKLKKLNAVRYRNNKGYWVPLRSWGLWSSYNNDIHFSWWRTGDSFFMAQLCVGWWGVGRWFRPEQWRCSSFHSILYVKHCCVPSGGHIADSHSLLFPHCVWEEKSVRATACHHQSYLRKAHSSHQLGCYKVNFGCVCHLLTYPQTANLPTDVEMVSLSVSSLDSWWHL